MRVFRNASRGEYRPDSEEVRDIRREMMERQSSLKSDRENLVGDKHRVAADVRTSFNKIAFG